MLGIKAIPWGSVLIPWLRPATDVISFQLSLIKLTEDRRRDAGES